MDAEVEAAEEASVTGVVRGEAVDNNTHPRRSTPQPSYAKLADISMDLSSAMEANKCQEIGEISDCFLAKHTRGRGFRKGVRSFDSR